MKTIQHLTISIDSLLQKSNDELSRIFGGNGETIRIELNSRKQNGEKYIPSDRCKDFSPYKGCLCGLNNYELMKQSYDDFYRGFMARVLEATDDLIKSLISKK